MSVATTESVCTTCGACCAALRVGFAEHEGVAAGLTEPWIPGHRRMRGTAASPPRCVALDGEVGRRTSCTIYASRPSPCRDLQPSVPGRPSPWCDAARAAHGLPPLG
jgi:Fe-S-cluster containining protein